MTPEQAIKDAIDKLELIKKVKRKGGVQQSKIMPSFRETRHEYDSRLADEALNSLRATLDGLDEDVILEKACKAYDDMVDELGDSAMEHYCNDVPMRAAIKAIKEGL